VVAPAAAAAATVVKDIPASGWIVGGVLVAGAGYLWLRTVKGIFGKVADIPGDIADAGAKAVNKTIDVFEDAGGAALDLSQDAAAAAVDEVQDLGRFLGSVGAKADKNVSKAVDNAIKDVKTSAVVVTANRTLRNAQKGASKATSKVSSGVKSTKKKAKKLFRRLF
jgi:methionine synthase II (cobalamin-independent)